MKKKLLIIATILAALVLASIGYQVLLAKKNQAQIEKMKPHGLGRKVCTMFE